VAEALLFAGDDGVIDDEHDDGEDQECHVKPAHAASPS
jgi:hypothetical protein